MPQQGFFNLGPLAASKPPAKSRGVSDRGSGCEACQRYTDCLHPRFGVEGKGRKKILVVIETPTARDDQKGRLLSGDSGVVLHEVLEQVGLSSDDIWVVPAVRCVGPEVTGQDVGDCHQYLAKAIETYKPKVIVAMGLWSVFSVIGQKFTGRLTSVKPSQAIGFAIPDRGTGAWVVGTYALQHMVGADRKRDLKLLFRQQWEKVVECVDKEFPIIPDSYKCVYQLDEAKEWLREIIRTAKKVAFDYETTGLKPQRSGHKIICASVAWHRNGQPFAVSFPFFSDLLFRTLWRKLLTTESIGKVAHNNAFEEMWTYWRANCEGIPRYWVKGWVGDTCLQAHCLNNRAPTSLKWEVAWRYGVFGYDAAIDEYLKSPKKDGANGFNRMAQVMPAVMLPYNAKDSLFSLVLDDDQKSELSEHQKPGAAFFVESISSLTKVSSNGLLIDAELTEKTRQDLSVELAQYERELQAMPEAHAVPHLNLNSGPQLISLLYDKLGYPEQPELGKSVDEEALEAIGTPFTQQIVKVRKTKKMRDTYIEGFLRESVQGTLRAFFHLHKVDTFRGSSSDPNFQNFPKRDKEALRRIRGGFRPSPGNKFIEYDYKSVEVGIGCCYHKDPAMINYIEDETTDMHRDTAFGLFLRGPDDILKPERQAAKNGFVFPSFYGSVAENMAHGLWVQLGEETKQHLRNKGLKTFADFKAHVIEYEKEFWGVRFQGYGEWRNRIWADYQRKGYIDLYTGFRMYGPLKRTQATNGQIQGTAFHCLLRTLGKARPEIEAISGRSRIIGQIHDSMVCDIHPDDEAECDRIIKYYGTQEIREAWPWIIVPLTIEKDCSEVDGKWSEMKACGAL